MVRLNSVSLRAPITDAPIISSITLHVGKGERVAILGPSGCGKSSLFEMLVGHFPPSSGSFAISDDEFNRKGCPKSVGYLPQNSLELIMPWLTSRKNIELVGRLRANEEEKPPFSADELFKRMNLTLRESAYPLVLSGGERRRLALAMILSFSPRLILLDEPFTGVDLDLRFNLWDLVFDYHTIRQIKPTVFLVTHSLEEAAILCDQVIFLKRSDEGTIIHSIAKRRNQFVGDWNTKPSLIYRNRTQLNEYLSYLDNEFKEAIS
jgi:NitT/TauT family transport system ATP-binding protein